MLEWLNRHLLELLNKIFFRLFVFLTGNKCPHCSVRKFVGTPLTRYEDGELGFGGICFNCFACYRQVGGKMTFDRYLDKDLFE